MVLNHQRQVTCSENIWHKRTDGNPIIPALGRLSQKTRKFEVKPYLEKKKSWL
jgi:hypothetical protein